MDYAEMQFAYTVDKLARGIRQADRGAHYTDVLDRFDEASREAQMAAWDKDNPVSHYFPLALSRLEEAAEIIRRLRP